VRRPHFVSRVVAVPGADGAAVRGAAAAAARAAASVRSYATPAASPGTCRRTAQTGGAARDAGRIGARPPSRGIESFKPCASAACSPARRRSWRFAFARDRPRCFPRPFFLVPTFRLQLPRRGRSPHRSKAAVSLPGRRRRVRRRGPCRRGQSFCATPARSRHRRPKCRPQGACALRPRSRHQPPHRRSATRGRPARPTFRSPAGPYWVGSTRPGRPWR
jgi:hypothetical protein